MFKIKTASAVYIESNFSLKSREKSHVVYSWITINCQIRSWTLKF